MAYIYMCVCFCNFMLSQCSLITVLFHVLLHMSKGLVPTLVICKIIPNVLGKLLILCNW